MMIQLKSLNKTIIFLCFVSILLLSFNAFYKTDDYGFMNDLNKLGVIKNCIEGYFDWDGRFLSLGAFFQGGLLKYFSIEFVFLFWTLCFLMSGFLVQYILTNGSYKLDFTPNLSTGLLLSVLLWFVSIPILSEVVYWGVGGVYAFDLLVGTIWIMFFLKYQESEVINKQLLFLLFTVITGGLTQNLSIPLIVLVLITLFTSRKEKNKFNLVTFLFLCLGLCFIQFAPGNLIRIQAMNLKKLDFSFFQLLKNLLWILFVFSQRIYLLLFLFFIFTLVYFKEFSDGCVKFLKIIRISALRNKDFLNFFKWTIVALSSITPFVLIPEFISLRTTIFFVFFQFLFFLELGFLFFKKIKMEKFNNSIIIFLFGSFVLSLNVYLFMGGLRLKAEINEREEMLKKSNGKILNVKLINPNLSNFIYNYSDYGYPETPENIWVKRSQEKYFNVKINVVK